MLGDYAETVGRACDNQSTWLCGSDTGNTTLRKERIVLGLMLTVARKLNIMLRNVI